ncbi:hypothetical protein QUB80_10430 [Chlorogloeopsis sp. ULAP01]|uniref:hypothetical protein n=1 Tax=Chlorogloeopsis sp. ULAP01 TaxID=3056483 RepID=UPI0025AA745A|nr:hypothetical protein [Chlorogloeopsis sp. ULAP01]MDM9381120.1 hypothetical protein [Chlorogloeopsis sp. ULAP01]
MQLLVAGMIVSLGFLPSLAQAQKPVSDYQVSTMVEALRLAAPKTDTSNDGLYSAWQVKPETLKSWSKYCLKKEVTPMQFENNPALARQVVSCIMRRELNNQYTARQNNEIAAMRGVACWWMTGYYTGCKDGLTGAYVQKVVDYYQQQRSKPVSNTSQIKS